MSHLNVKSRRTGIVCFVPWCISPSAKNNAWSILGTQEREGKGPWCFQVQCWRESRLRKWKGWLLNSCKQPKGKSVRWDGLEQELANKYLFLFLYIKFYWNTTVLIYVLTGCFLCPVVAVLTSCNRPCGLQNLKYLLSGSLQKNFAYPEQEYETIIKE